MTIAIHVGDCREVLKLLPADSVDSCVTDPPYGLGFMGKDWDKFAPGDIAMRRNPQMDAVNTGAAKQGGRQRACKDYQKRQAREMREFQAWAEQWAAEVYRVLKPGAHLVAFGGTRTYHRLTCAIEDAGFEIRDCLGWLYGSGFPKSLDVSKAIDKAGPLGQTPFAEFAAHYEDRRKASGMTHAQICAKGGWFGNVNHGGSSANWGSGYGMPTVEQWVVLQPMLGLDDIWAERVRRIQYEREVLGIKPGAKLAVAPGQNNDRGSVELPVTAPGSEAARQWAGWGTALKPAWEPIILARKPLSGTVAENVQEHGTGALNIGACRVPGAKPDTTRGAGGQHGRYSELGGQGRISDDGLGRWPANICHDGSEEVLAVFPESDGTGGRISGASALGQGSGWNAHQNRTTEIERRNDSGSASRFFYCAKASREDRNAGLEGRDRKAMNWSSGEQSPGTFQSPNTDRRSENHHPTVKPTDLMQWLCRLITPPGGTVLDPFMGSGSTGKAADREGFHFIGIELDPEYAEIAKARIQGDCPLFSQVVA